MLYLTRFDFIPDIKKRTDFTQGMQMRWMHAKHIFQEYLEYSKDCQTHRRRVHELRSFSVTRVSYQHSQHGRTLIIILLGKQKHSRK